MPNAVVVIEGDHIVAAGPRSEINIAAAATVVDAGGKTLLAGLWDMHAHYSQVEWGPVYLAAGVTTVRDCQNEVEFITAVRDAIQSGHGLGPRILLAGLIDGQDPRASGIDRAGTSEEARTVVNRYKNAGYQQIKLFESLKPEIVPVITAEAHRLGMSVTGHVPRAMSTFEGVQAGMDQINHIGYAYAAMLPKGFDLDPNKLVPPLDLESAEAKRAIRFLKEHGTVVDDTLAIHELLAHPQGSPAAAFEPGAEKVPHALKQFVDHMGTAPVEAANGGRYFRQLAAFAGALHRAGVPIFAGSDECVPGHSLHRELELYVKAGFTPMEAIQAATIVPARVMKLDKEVATIEAGKRADLIIVDGNPLENISNIRKVKTVIAGGRMYDCAKLWQSVGFKP